MAKRAGRVGQWVLPISASAVSLTALWAIGRVLGLLLPAHRVEDVLRDTPISAGDIIIANVTAVVGVLALAAAAATLAAVVYMLLAIFQFQTNQAAQNQIEAHLHRQGELLTQVTQELMLSDRAKAVTYREQERDALRHAIQEELDRSDWEAAYHLIDEMQRSFGYHVEADRLRAEVDQRRQDTVIASMTADMGLFRELLNNCNWPAARLEAQKIAAHYPERPETRNLLAEVDEAREAYKRRLLSEFKQAIDRSEFDRGVSLLKELDQYLTPGEAAGLQEAARGVVRGKLHNLGVQFSMAISGKNWAEAIRIGEEIIAEFPNCRMAEEVRQNLDALRKRATEPAVAVAAAPAKAPAKAPV